MRKRDCGFVLTALASAALVVGCGGDSEEDSEASLTVYVSAPLTGPAGTDGRDVADAAKLALEDASGEAGGLAVSAEYIDVAGRDESRSDPVTAGENARTASEDSTTIAYVGELDSATARTSIPITNLAGILQVAPGSGASDLVTAEPFTDDIPTEIQGSGRRTFARLLPADEEVAEELGEELISGPAPPSALPQAGQDLLDRFQEEYDRPPGPWVGYGYEAMASVLAAIDRALDPDDRSSVIDAYFDGTERDSVLGTYSITEEGETTLDEPLRGYRVTADGRLVPD